MLERINKNQKVVSAQISERIPHSLPHAAGDAAARLASAVEVAGSRVAVAGSRVANTAGAAGDHVAGIGGRLGTKLSHIELDLHQPTTRGMEMVSVAKRKAIGACRPAGGALLKAQLARRSRELAHESTDLALAIDSLNDVIKANRRAAKRSRVRMIGGAAIGAALMYHLDADHGRQRRAATAERVRMITGRAQRGYRGMDRRRGDDRQELRRDTPGAGPA